MPSHGQGDEDGAISAQAVVFTSPTAAPLPQPSAGRERPQAQEVLSNDTHERGE